MRSGARLETVAVTIPAAAVPAYEAAFEANCTAVGIFIADEKAGLWRVEGVRPVGESGSLKASIALAELASGIAAPLHRQDTEADGWLARVYEGFPEQSIGDRFAIRGTHIKVPPAPGRITLWLDAGLAFGSGEHGSTRGCLRALERVAHRKPRRILDMGCGSGILAMAAARLLHRQVLAVDIDPFSTRVARQNARLNGISPLLRVRLGNGYQAAAVRGGAQFDLIFANILARPLCRMAGQLALHLAPGGTAILAGLLAGQARAVLAAHRRHGLVLDGVLREAAWTTLILKKR
ncbi:MAG TPA: 50S ribosomal protein L11 methyltransferase [Acetobacteraceae bacterium]|nr:50S ribosomal protein L11 methyltransferase [Acetobacteraceae bacterium]